MPLSLQEGVLSPVQDGDNKPQIDSNKANNYKIVKEVSSESFSGLFLFFSQQQATDCVMMCDF